MNMAEDCNVNFPVAGLITNAEIDWLQGFMKRREPYASQTRK
jgi:hypothetical protein